jgi:uncharacterized protein (TIGR01777 family)
MTSENRYVIAGGSGMLGQALAHSLVSDGAEVIILTRHPRDYRGPGLAAGWDGVSVDFWADKLEGAAGLVNLAGAPINQRWTEANKRRIIESRVRSVFALEKAIGECQVPPRVWVQASAVGIYGDRGDETLTESSEPSTDPNDFMAKVCRKWEEAFAQSAGLPCRKVLMRLGVVLSRRGGAFPLLRRLTRFFLGGSVGTGSQWMPWIHQADVTRLFRHALNDETMTGIYNVVAPEPVTNRRLMQLLRKDLHRPWAPPAPAFAAKLGGTVLGIPVEPALMSQRVEPSRVLETSFSYTCPTPAGALDELTGR